MLVHLARLVLAPVIYPQARRMHATTVMLPEPEGERSGACGTGTALLRLLVVGDSSAVGVGAPTQDQGLAVPLARRLAEASRATVRWQLIGQTGLHSAGVLKQLEASLLEPADVAIVVVGANDITNEVPLAAALRHRAQIVSHLRERARVKHVIIPSLPEMECFPAIPQPLAWYAGLHARRNNRAQARWVRTQANVHHADISGVTTAALMASDGYHPSPALYALIAERLSQFVVGVVAVEAGEGISSMSDTSLEAL